ncbi:hypothetical protein BpHYR1_041995 [Brachionus plicatilis]|uniref:Uncharacterized protein n=1 Tax=Brachionus plicatilis TaxID=10195 RepID=A0A3M7R395_BRAPC|nr:hypothetical protein BpHYR1_041995 [Brachionus plicatilis]
MSLFLSSDVTVVRLILLYIHHSNDLISQLNLDSPVLDHILASPIFYLNNSFVIVCQFDFRFSSSSSLTILSFSSSELYKTFDSTLTTLELLSLVVDSNTKRKFSSSFSNSSIRVFRLLDKSFAPNFHLAQFLIGFEHKNGEIFDFDQSLITTCDK